MGEEDLTAVTVSMHRTKGSEVRYRESESEYSFHSCPKRSCAPPMRVWLRAKYPATIKLLAPTNKGTLAASHLRRKDGWCQLVWGVSNDRVKDGTGSTYTK